MTLGKSSAFSLVVGESETPSGAYGFSVDGVDGARALLVYAPKRDWPRLHLSHRAGRSILAEDVVTDEHAEIRLLSGGTVEIDRSPMRAVYTVPKLLSDHELVHPYFAVAATVAARWLGRDSFHAGAVAIDGGSWAFVGGRDVGKSSTIAWLALHGYDVLCDDVLVVANGQVLAGPRAVDLRQTAANELGAGERLGIVGGRERWRLMLGQVEPATPLRGWFFLGWGDELSARRLAPRERPAALAPHLSVRLPPRDPTTLLTLASLPAWELRRPRDWDAIETFADLVLDLIHS